MKRFLSIWMALILLLCGSLCAPALAADSPTMSGACVENLTWALQDGTLTIRGTGDMMTYRTFGLAYIPESVPPRAPWNAVREQIRAVVLEEGVTSIGDGAFEGCVNLQAVTIPQSVRKIGHGAFGVCDALDIQIPATVTQIDRYAFRGCNRVDVDAANPSYRSDADGVVYAENGAHLIHYPVRCAKTAYTIPSDVRTIEEFAFHKCQKLEHLTVPGSVESIAFAFMYCLSLRTAVLQPGLKSVGLDAFYGCKNLRSVELPEGLESIDSKAFFGTALTHLHIPQSVTQILMFDLTPAFRKDDTVFPYLQPFYICADSADCAAKAYADEQQIRFYVCNGKHDAPTELMHRSPVQQMLYVFFNGKQYEMLVAVIDYVGNRLKTIVATDAI